MSFRLRISIVFILLVGSMLTLFGSYLYLQSARISAREFYRRLDERADLTERIVREAGRLPFEERDKLERALYNVLPNEALAIFSHDGRTLFQRAGPLPALPKSWIETALNQGVLHVEMEGRYYVVHATDIPEKGGSMIAVASAEDRRGGRELSQLRRSLVIASMLLLVLTVAIAWGFATWTLEPVRALVRKANAIQEPSQRLPVVPGRKDELSNLTNTFNALLGRLEDTFQVQRSFIASASHELRTPLTIMRGALHHAAQRAEGMTELTNKLRTIESQALHMQDMLAQLLVLARIQGPSEHITTDLIRLDEIAERAMERCRSMYSSSSIRFDIQDGSGSEPLVRGNAVLLTAGFYNLLTNAAKYGGDSPIDLVLAKHADERWSLSVTDKGPGMPAEVLARAREMFYRGSETIMADGLGVGLALVDRIAKVHGAEFSIETSKDQGTMATLQFPVAMQEE